MSRKFLSAQTLVAAFVIALTSPAAADSHWPNGCDATEQLEVCANLGGFYAQGADPFPKDTKRSASLVRGAREAAIQACHDADPDGCALATTLIMADADLNTDERFALAAAAMGAMDTYCRAGDPFMCEARVSTQTTRALAPLHRNIEKIAAAGQGPRWHDIISEPNQWSTIQTQVTKDQQDTARTACDAGDQAGCLMDARLHARFTPGGSIDHARTTPLFDACLSGTTTHCGSISFLMRNLKYTDKEAFATRAEQIRAACEQGVGPMCRILPSLVAREERQSARLLGCNMGVATSCTEAAMQDFNDWKRASGEDTDALESATTSFTRGCELGDAFACHFLEHISKG